MTLLPSLAPISPLLLAAGSDDTKTALVVGNSAYPAAPLVNPKNDATAVGKLFGEAGFAVDTRLDTSRVDLLEAIESFGRRVQESKTRLAVFYYAGHGAQLDWRNYLLPVDADVRSAQQLKERCVDLGILLGKLNSGRDKTFIIILDACRNDPFGGRFRPGQQGLSQFDAPVGSLLAYATAPGNVAADGEGAHGLYTENLLRELAVRGTRLEDCLKRVRLNVRLQSRGEQVPWETTSLEQDVFIFNGAATLSEADLEKQLEAEIAEWQRIKGSKNIADWAAYLRRFPGGRFAEIAQSRLDRLMVSSVPARTPVTVAGKPAVSDPGGELESPVVLQAGGAQQLLWKPSENPYSAGCYPLGRSYALGDKAVYRESDYLTKLLVGLRTHKVTGVDTDNDRVEINNGLIITDLMGNPIKLKERSFDPPVQFYPVDLQIGRKWKAAYQISRRDGGSTAYYDMHVAKREKVEVPAGLIECFLIEGQGFSEGGRRMNGGALTLTARLWVVPGINFLIRSELLAKNVRNQFVRTEVLELLSLQQRDMKLF